MSRRVLVLLICAAMALLSGCAAKNEPNKELDKITLVLDWTPNTNHTGIYAAKELGCYAEEGLEIEIVQPPEDGALALVATGKADFGVSFQEEVLFAANAEPPLPIVAVAAMLEHNTSGIISLKEKGIERFADLEGKNYGSWQIPVYDEIISECIISDGGDPSNVAFVPNAAMDSISGIMYDFDATWVYEGWDKVIADMRGIETNFLPLRDANPVFDYYTPVLVTNKSALSENRDMVIRFLKATEKGYAYAKQNPSESADILGKYAPEIDKDILIASQEALSSQYFSEKWGEIDEARWNGFFDWLKSHGLINETAAERAFEVVEF